MTASNAFHLAKVAAAQWNEHNAPRLAAALAYYSLLALAPAVVVLLAIYSLVFSHGAAEQQLLNQAHLLLGYTGENAIKALNEDLQHGKSGLRAALIAGVIVCLGASGVFVELRDSLNTIWDVKTKGGFLKEVVVQRIVSVVLMIGLGLLSLASLAAGMVLNMIQAKVLLILPVDGAVLGGWLNVLVSFAATVGLFALIFKLVPDASIHWSDVGIGAVATAVLFTAGRTLLAFYFGKAAIGSTYGAAGSLVAFVIWVYYSAQIFLYGAVLTRVYARYYGSDSLRARAKVVAR